MFGSGRRVGRRYVLRWIVAMTFVLLVLLLGSGENAQKLWSLLRRMRVGLHIGRLAEAWVRYRGTWGVRRRLFFRQGGSRLSLLLCVTKASKIRFKVVGWGAVGGGVDTARPLIPFVLASPRHHWQSTAVPFVSTGLAMLPFPFPHSLRGQWTRKTSNTIAGDPLAIPATATRRMGTALETSIVAGFMLGCLPDLKAALANEIITVSHRGRALEICFYFILFYFILFRKLSNILISSVAMKNFNDIYFENAHIHKTKKK